MDRRRGSDETSGRSRLNEEETVTVHIKYRDTEQTFKGNADSVWKSMNRFFGEMLPALQVIKKAFLTIDLEKLIEDCEKIIAVTPEGPVLLVSKQKLTDSETILLHLLATYISNKLMVSEDYLTKEELQARIAKTAKITSTRLGELCREGYTIKTEEGNYKITTLGIKHSQEETLPQIIEKIHK
jgi:hypothetical protein